MNSGDEPLQPLVAVVGPTAVGKTTLALHLAQTFKGEVVNADSRQVYRHMDVGTAKPTPEERKRVSHHLIDILGPDEEFSLATFLELARKAITDIHSRGGLPVLVGGTGQYVWALLEGWRVPTVAPDPSLRRELEARGATALYGELQKTDPQSAATIGPTNLRRLVRALEVYYATGVPFSQTRRKGPAPFRTLVLGLTTSRQELYRRIDERVDVMLERGWLEEAQRLLDMGYSPDLPSLSSLGYRELVSHLRGEISLREAAKRIKQETHRFARHQYAWFRPRDPRIRWLEAGPHADEEAVKLVRRFVEGFHED